MFELPDATTFPAVSSPTPWDEIVSRIVFLEEKVKDLQTRLKKVEDTEKTDV